VESTQSRRSLRHAVTDSAMTTRTVRWISGDLRMNLYCARNHTLDWAVRQSASEDIRTTLNLYTQDDQVEKRAALSAFPSAVGPGSQFRCELWRYSACYLTRPIDCRRPNRSCPFTAAHTYRVAMASFESACRSPPRIRAG
jgi:hypothetical protein